MSGEALSEEEVAALPDGAHVVVTWSGGNGPHRYVIAVREGEPYVWDGTTEALHWYNPLTFVGQERYHTRVWLDPHAENVRRGNDYFFPIYSAPLGGEK